jgi:mono/diheme cytochrome c family protein
MRSPVAKATLVALALTCAALVSVVARSEDSAPSKKAWPAQMRELEKTLNDLLFDTSSDARFSDKKNFATIDKNLAKFAKIAGELYGKTAAPDKDPSLRMISEDFAKESKYASDAMAAGHREYARVMIGSLTGYCIACHTRNPSGPQYTHVKLDSRLGGLKSLEKANYLAATRNFDQAFSEYEKIVKGGGEGGDSVFIGERALRGALGIAVRVKRDPELALKVVDVVASNPKTPFYLRERATAWKKSLVEWKNEKKKDGATGDAVYDEAVRLVGAAKAAQKFPADRSADVLYLRASSVVHDLLAVTPPGPLAAKANYLAGLCYEVLDDYGIRDFNEYYYRMCIRSDPHTVFARECYRRYEESVYFGYTGSGGTYVPADVRARLNEFELLSVPVSTPKAADSELQ